MLRLIQCATCQLFVIICKITNNFWVKMFQSFIVVIIIIISLSLFFISAQTNLATKSLNVLANQNLQNK